MQKASGELITTYDGDFDFNFFVVQPATTIYIDPLVAIGYDFLVNSGPLVQSVVVPNSIGAMLDVTLRQARGNAPDRFAECVDARTRVIGVSYVSYLTGERHDLSALRALADG